MSEWWKTSLLLIQQLVELAGLLEEKTLGVETVQEIIEIPLELYFPHGGESLHLVNREDPLVLVRGGLLEDWQELLGCSSVTQSPAAHPRPGEVHHT